jgi:hypothetical protein
LLVLHGFNCHCSDFHSPGRGVANGTQSVDAGFSLLCRTLNQSFSNIVKVIPKQAATLATPATPLQISALFWPKSYSHIQLRAIGEFEKVAEM